jgi:hypothetical protein
VAHYFKIQFATEVFCTIRHRKLGDSDWDRINVWCTESLKETYPTLTIHAYRQNVIPDYFEAGPRPIVSERLRQFLDGFDVCAEFIPIKVTIANQNPAPGSPFWFLHMLEEIPCIDFEKSLIERHSDDPNDLISRIKKLVFKESIIGDRLLFRPSEYGLLFVSDFLREALQSSGFTGITFVPVEEVWM